MAKERSIWLGKPPGYIRKLDEGILIKCDALKLLNSLKDGCADIIFLDPPFNLGKKYGSKSKKGDKITESEYEEFMRSVLFSSMRKVVRCTCIICHNGRSNLVRYFSNN